MLMLVLQIDEWSMKAIWSVLNGRIMNILWGVKMDALAVWGLSHMSECDQYFSFHHFLHNMLSLLQEVFFYFVECITASIKKFSSSFLELSVASKWLIIKASFLNLEIALCSTLRNALVHNRFFCHIKTFFAKEIC